MTSSSKSLRDVESVLADFAETTHVPTSYINSNLSAVGTQTQITESSRLLLNDLEAASSLATARLGGLVDDMLRMAPRLGYEVEILRGGIQSMTEVVHQIEPKRVNLAHKGEAAITQLKVLDRVKTQMDETSKVLEEAKAWSPATAIEEPLNVLIANKEWAQASKQIVKYEGLLQVWRGTTEFAKRKAVVDRIRRILLAQRQQDGIAKQNVDLARLSMDSQRSNESSAGEEGYYSSFIKRAFKT